LIDCAPNDAFDNQLPVTDHQRKNATEDRDKRIDSIRLISKCFFSSFDRQTNIRLETIHILLALFERDKERERERETATTPNLGHVSVNDCGFVTEFELDPKPEVKLSTFVRLNFSSVRRLYLSSLSSKDKLFETDLVFISLLFNRKK
jgi:hypothetical protein